MNTNATDERLIVMLDNAGAHYRLIDHPPERQTEVVSQFRGHETREAAKCIIMDGQTG
jgi:Ala-tRNA(Pro) deacylase